MKKIAMLIGGVYHPFAECGRIGKGILEASGRYAVDVTEDVGLLADGLSGYGGLVIYTCGLKMTDDQCAGLETFVRAGGALAAVHSATACFSNCPRYFRLVGSRFETHPPEHLWVRISLSDPLHPVTVRLGDFDILEELYLMTDVREDVQVLATTRWRGQTIPMMYTRTEGAGRVFYTALGHGVKQWNHPKFQKSLLRGLDWACGHEPKPGPVRCGVLGFSMGKTHAELIADTPGLELAAICDSRPDRLREAGEKYPEVRTMNDAGRMLADDGVDLVSVVLPHNLHKAYCLKALEAGKHVVVDKPFTITVAEADEVIAAAEKAGKMLSVFHNRRWDGDYMTIRRLVAEGTIGRVFEASVGFAVYKRTWLSGWWTDKAVSGGALYPWAPHMSDWILTLVNDRVASVMGFFQKAVWMDYTCEDHAEAIIRFAGGTRGSVFISDIYAAPRPRWRIVGTKGAIVDDGSVQDGCKVMTFQDGSVVNSEVKWDGPHRWVEYYWNVADHLLFRDPLAVTAQDGRRAVGVLEYAERSAACGRSEALPGEEDLQGKAT